MKIHRFFSNIRPSKISIREAIRQGMVEEMHRDPSVFLIGEEVA